MDLSTRERERMFENCLKPGRYAGGELNTSQYCRKKAALNVALAFPDTYEIGQSGLGLKILSAILAQDPDISVDRVFAPWTDYEEILRKNATPLAALETGRPLKDFDLIGFSLLYEMSYTNILNMLELAQIPLLAKDRDEKLPLIIAGGTCAYNPEPIADFFDFFVLGEGEEVITEIAVLVKNSKNISRKTLLEKAAAIEGVYVPSFYSPRYDDSGKFLSLEKLNAAAPDYIRKRTVKDLDRALYPVAPAVPFIETIHDRIMLEISRGCTRGCRFCQAGMIYRPVRERSEENLLRLADESVNRTGYEEISLSSLSCSDHSRIGPIVRELQKKYEKRYIELSLPSLRIDAFSVGLAQLVQRFRRTTLTFAPEVGTDKMRDMVNKGGSEEEVIETAKNARKAGWNSLKLYFLTGLPYEEEEDITGITKLVWKILQATGMKLTISFSSFVPKAHTPFQWAPFVSIEETKERQGRIKRLLKHGKITSNFHMAELSFMEAVFACGDRKLSQVLMAARRKGCKFDSWNDLFRFDLWMEAFRECGIDPESYTAQKDPEGGLPWDHLSPPQFRRYLRQEKMKAENRIPTGDCRMSCNGCGLCSGGLSPVVVSAAQQESVQPLEGELLCSTLPVCKIRLRYEKSGKARLTSHLDVIRMFQRAVRRADLPVSYTSGFHPRMRLTPGPALPLGLTSSCEWADLELMETLTPKETAERLNQVLPEGFRILGAWDIPLTGPSLSQIITASDFEFRPPADTEAVQMEQAAEKLLQSESLPVKRKDKLVDIRPYLLHLNTDKDEEGKPFLRARVAVTPGGSAKPQEILTLLNLGEPANWEAARTDCFRGEKDRCQSLCQGTEKMM